MEPDGRLLAGRYQLLAPLASGGMGRVWRARDTLLDRPVAVKVLRSEFTGDPSFLARFRAEAQHAAVLVHPNLASVYDYGELVADGERLAFLVMELVEGEPLSALLARERRLDVPRTLGIVSQTAAALAVAHEAGVVHRDVKPGNVLVAQDGTVKITDFGIAWSASSVPLTQTGQVIGTAHYLSPEQAAGGKATPASDVYALGAVAYECLAGRRAFDGENSVQIAVKQIREEPAPLPADLPAEVRGLVERALTKDPTQRYADGAAFRDAAQAVLAGRPVADEDRTGTAVMPVAGLPTGPATRPIDVPAAAGNGRPARASAGLSGRADPGSGTRQRRGFPRALVAGLALAALGFLALVLLWGGGDAPATEPPPPAAGRTVTAGDFVGRSLEEVTADLQALGLVVDARPLQNADVPAGQVTAVTPEGVLAEGTSVVVSYAVAPPPPAPTEVPVPEEESGDAEVVEKAAEEAEKAAEEAEKAAEQREEAAEEAAEDGGDDDKPGKGNGRGRKD